MVAKVIEIIIPDIALVVVHFYDLIGAKPEVWDSKKLLFYLPI